MPGALSWLYGDEACLGSWSVVQQFQESCHFLVKEPMLQCLGMLRTEHKKLLGRQDEGGIRAGSSAGTLGWKRCRYLVKTQPTTSPCPWESGMVESAENPSRDQCQPPASSFRTNLVSFMPSRSAVGLSVLTHTLRVKQGQIPTVAVSCSCK